ncbi:hypothetical protein CLV84_3881 [Neolewinella xylanilytica]|uniref:Uncharacterized protein n=1 Tax=Neolewinella xylanilytica TaxID=1514080 RepID=A0A2S6I169_9BACT|nr:hypothetical protein [Neolewinella xylanilytica]PPK84719.1 hypothetical protein CLV84_3881 [Neolewinella xylanilytica]
MLRFTILFLSLLFASATVSAKKGESIFDRWSRTAEKTIEIHLNFDTLLANRKTEREMRGVVIDNGQAFGVDISVRGRYRRRTCVMPPIKLQFDKDLLRTAGLNTHNDYKLVTHCTVGERGQDALVREALIYELYRTLEPEASFRTQLLTINYVNTADGSTFTSYAILIEDTDELKDRLDRDNCKDCYNAPYATFTNIEKVTLFQYMIGNLDYSTKLGRNLKLMQDEQGRITAVPYDFDFSGLVSPEYGRLMHPDQQAMTDRILVWEFPHDPEFDRAADEMLLLETDLLQMVATYPELNSQSKREITRYLKSFYKELHRGKIGR